MRKKHSKEIMKSSTKSLMSHGAVQAYSTSVGLLLGKVPVCGLNS